MQPNNNIEKRRHLFKNLELHFIVFIWGFTAVLGKLIPLDALKLVWYRIGIALPVLAVWMIWKKVSFHLTLRQAVRYILGGLTITLHWISFFTAIKVSNVSLTLVVLSSGAVFAALLEPVFYRRKIRYSEVMMGLLISLGIYWVVRISGFNWEGVLWGLLAALTSAWFSVMNGIFVRENIGSKLSFYQLLSGFLALTLYLFAAGAEIFPVNMSQEDWTYLLLLSVICTAYPFAQSINLMRYISPYTVMLTVNMEPVYGILLALIIFGEEERMQPLFYAGTLLILGIILWNGRMKMKKI